MKAFAALVLARNFCMALLGLDGGVYTVVTVNDFCFWSFGGAFFSAPPGVPFWGPPFKLVLDMVTGNAPGVKAVWSLIGPGGADTALIFGSTKLTVGPVYVSRKDRKVLIRGSAVEITLNS